MKKATGFLKRGLRIDEKERTGERWRRRHEREKVKKKCECRGRYLCVRRDAKMGKMYTEDFMRETACVIDAC